MRVESYIRKYEVYLILDSLLEDIQVLCLKNHNMKISILVNEVVTIHPCCPFQISLTILFYLVHFESTSAN